MFSTYIRRSVSYFRALPATLGAQKSIKSRLSSSQIFSEDGSNCQQGGPIFIQTRNMSTRKRKACIIGSGNWGSAIAKIVGVNAAKYPMFEDCVNMFCYEELLNGRKLTDIINTEHENVKYLPGHKLPENIVAIPDVKEAVAGADILIFVVPHQFVAPICSQMKGSIEKNVSAISLIKGLSHTSVGLKQMSDVIEEMLDITCSVLMGANLADEVAAEKFTETTIGCKNKSEWDMWKSLFHCDYFKVNCVADDHTVELCGALKNVVAVGAGFVDALGYGENTKAAVIRLGMTEMKRFGEIFYDGINESTFLESCGIADLIATCYGGRNRKVAKAFALTGKSMESLEAEMLNGQKLQGPHTAYQVNLLLKERNLENEFPLMTSIYQICYEGEPPSHLIATLSEHF